MMAARITSETDSDKLKSTRMAIGYSVLEMADFPVKFQSGPC